ncbi:hypothetical protein [Thermococcus sp.]
MKKSLILIKASVPALVPFQRREFHSAQLSKTSRLKNSRTAVFQTGCDEGPLMPWMNREGNLDSSTHPITAGNNRGYSGEAQENQQWNPWHENSAFGLSAPFNPEKKRRR